MKPIFIFNDKLLLCKDELLQTIINGLKIHFVNVVSVPLTAKNVNQRDLIKSKFKVSAIFFTSVDQYDTALKFAFDEKITIVENEKLFETIWMPQLVFICDFAKEKIPDAHAEKFNIISIE